MRKELLVHRRKHLGGGSKVQDHRRATGCGRFRIAPQFKFRVQRPMPRPRVPQEKARITGADIKVPARFAGRSDPKSTPLGDRSVWMSGDLRLAWISSEPRMDEFRAEIPWLMESDR